MQKKLIALAIASLSGGAFAQSSNVTIYGIVDSTFDVINVSGGQRAVPTAVPPIVEIPSKGTPNFTRVQSNGSRLGVKGTENLGNGMSAFFQLESNAKFDAGGALDTGRDSFLGLKGNFGAIKMGNFSGPNRDLASKLDVVIHSDGIGDDSALLGKLGGRGSYFDTRYKNAIAYITPDFSGFGATLLYQANENKVDAPAASKINSSLYELGMNYTYGPLYIGAAYGKQREKNASGIGTFALGTDADASETRVGAIYDFGVATLRAMYGRTKGEGDDPAGHRDIHQNVWGVGGTYNVTANGKLLMQYFRAGDLSGKLPGITTDLSDTGANFWVLGYEHSLSKRTTLIAHYAYLKNDQRTGTVAGAAATKGYDFGDGATGFTGDDVKLSAFSVGLNHAF